METYDKCKKEKGKGVFSQIKQKLEEGVNHNKCTMFEEASRTVQNQLQQLMVWDLFVQSHILFTSEGPSWSRSYGSWIYNYLYAVIAYHH